MTEKRLHPAAEMYAAEYHAGELSRREFLSRATMLGVSATAAYALIGAIAPSKVNAAAAKGGTLRVNMETKAMKDPRLWDWTEYANFCRGWLDYMTQFNRDGSVTGSLIESWEANDDATQYTLNLRRGVKWNNGDDFTAVDVLHNFDRWADGTVEGNSMASRVAALQDPDTKKLREGSVVAIDDHTVQLNLNTSDISVMAALSDYPAAVVHRSYAGEDPVASPIGTGVYLPESYEVGVKAVLVRNPDHNYWREGGWLDRIEFIDLGTDQASLAAAAEGDEIDLTYRTDGDFVALFDGIGWQSSEVVTANTLAVRFNQLSAPYDNREVRRGIQLMVDNAKVLELGIGGLGLPGENHHVCPIHPEYAKLPPLEVDPAKGAEMIAAAGHSDTEIELISLDTGWQRNTCDAVASQIRDAGMNVKRTILPGATFWNDWTKYPFSATEWGPRPLGIQIMSLAYKSGAAWNESAFSNAEFDSLLEQGLSVADADARREIMAKMEKIMQDEGVLIQSYWRSVFNHSNGKFANVDVHPFYELALHDIHLKA
ncbi:ABC transporter substrate-binding protein [Ruegeria marina]|uniref:Peptide/nickel transport system substrate-binding protein n=1 Tax=Ruegeria marina TaxID=639004 RepID=A0A1G6UPF9_9RHOB|nr:ABC transporter substrate-binding protein [Ruegeria marina]SDD42445.1 peptide/nickel transport system substrate-binding protein [Ruegeria marina]